MGIGDWRIKVPEERNLKVKRLSESAKLPTKGSNEAAGWDLYATSREIKDGKMCYGTGIAMEIPTGYVGLIFPRSSIYKKTLRLCNSVGVIDSDYRGEIKFFFDFEPGSGANEYMEGDRVGQIIFIKLPEFNLEEVDELSDSDRGEGGFGSTGE